jgi:hypothetical protein
VTRKSSLPNLLARSGYGPQPAPFPTDTARIRILASDLSSVVCPHIFARSHPVHAGKPFVFNRPVVQQTLEYAHRPQTQAWCTMAARQRSGVSGHGFDRGQLAHNVPPGRVNLEQTRPDPRARPRVPITRFFTRMSVSSTRQEPVVGRKRGWRC